MALGSCPPLACCCMAQDRNSNFTIPNKPLRGFEEHHWRLIPISSHLDGFNDNFPSGAHELLNTMFGLRMNWKLRLHSSTFFVSKPPEERTRNVNKAMDVSLNAPFLKHPLVNKHGAEIFSMDR